MAAKFGAFLARLRGLEAYEILVTPLCLTSELANSDRNHDVRWHISNSNEMRQKSEILIQLVIEDEMVGRPIFSSLFFFSSFFPIILKCDEVIEQIKPMKMKIK